MGKYAAIDQREQYNSLARHVTINSMSNFEIKRLSECDWREYNSIRLESLQDSPDSFGSTYEQEISFSPKRWQSLLKIDPAFHHALAIAAVENETFIGLLSSVIHARDASNAHLYQMWVSPKYRGSGVGTALIDRVRTWALERNIVELELSVTTTNLDAISLYRSIGFAPTGIFERLREGSNRR